MDELIDAPLMEGKEEEVQEETLVSPTRSASTRSLRLEDESYAGLAEESLEFQAEWCWQVFSFHRDKIPELLLQIGSYEQLRRVLTHLEKKYPERNVVAELLLGQIGYPSSAQQAIYELPTRELVQVLTKLLRLFGSPKVHEAGAGQGLLARMLAEEGVIVRASDGEQWGETSNHRSHFPVERKIFLDLLTEELPHLLISWPPMNALVSQSLPDGRPILELVELLEKKKPRVVIIIGDPIASNEYTYSLSVRMQEWGYRLITIPAKQISYRDYFWKNEHYPKESSRSVINFWIDPDQVTAEFRTWCTEERVRRYLGKGTCHELVLEPTMPQMIQDLWVDGVIQEPLYRLMKPSTPGPLEDLIAEILTHSILIPKYLETLEELKFWWGEHQNQRYPLEISTREKFATYFQLMNQLGEQGYVLMIKQGYLPVWVESQEMAEQVVWLDYSHSNPLTYKESAECFKKEFNRLYGETFQTDRLSEALQDLRTYL